MDEVGMLYYERGSRYFELGRYEEAVSDWVKAFELGYEKKNILGNIYNCFIRPNEQEFQKNYGWGKKGVTALNYEECLLDFVPVSQDKFYIFDKEKNKFRGIFALEEKPFSGSRVTFHNILYAGIWDIREMLPDMKRYCRDVVYVLLDGIEARFFSFLKLPLFKELYLKNMIVFGNEEEMYAFFDENEEYYLPKQLVALDVEHYWNFINELHERRIHHFGAKRHNIFLSICIPTYNRGKLALENIRHLLSCPYDSEIEIIVSNNGSKKEREEYAVIQHMEDARVRYHEFEENQGYAANILKVCELVRGKYAVLVSDEDLMVIENLGEYLDFIKANPDCSVYYSNVKGKKPYEENFLLNAGLDAIKIVSTWNYITGVTYNMELCHKLKVIEQLDSLRCGYIVDWHDEQVMSKRDKKRNLYLEILTQEAIAVFLAYHADVAVTKCFLWDSEINNTETGSGFCPYYNPKSRIEKQNSFLNLCHQGLRLNKREMIEIFLVKCKRTHFLIYLAFHQFFEDMLKFGSEWEVQAWVYQEQIKFLESFPVTLTKVERREIWKQIARIEF